MVTQRPLPSASWYQRALVPDLFSYDDIMSLFFATDIHNAEASASVSHEANEIIVLVDTNLFWRGKGYSLRSLGLPSSRGSPRSIPRQ